MSRYRDFDAARAEHRGEPLVFVLAGREFSVPGVPVGPVLDMATSALRGDDVASYSAFAAFFEAVIPVDQAESFAAALREIRMDEIVLLGEIVGWLIEEATGRPLPSASSSHDPPSPNGGPSKLAWSSGDPSPSP